MTMIVKKMKPVKKSPELHSPDMDLLEARLLYLNAAYETAKNHQGAAEFSALSQEMKTLGLDADPFPKK